MLDTIAVKKFLSPSCDILSRKPIWKLIKNSVPPRFECNALFGTGLPRVTLTRSPDSMQHLRAEVSLPRWIKGSNSFLLTETEIWGGLEQLSKFVFDLTGEPFATSDMFVARVDFTKDLPVGENKIAPIIRRLTSTSISRTLRTTVDDTTIYFNSKGRSLNKRIAFYGKYREVLSREHSKAELEKALGVIRLEISYRRTPAVKTLVKKQDLTIRTAERIFRQDVADRVFREYIELLNLEQVMDHRTSILEKLEKYHSPLQAMKLLGFLQYLTEYGLDFYRLPFLQFGRTTYWRALKDCKRAGVLPRE